MSSLRMMKCDDLFKFNHINLDPLTGLCIIFFSIHQTEVTIDNLETYNMPFYLQYLSTWPCYCTVIEDPSNRLMGYILGKAEGDKKLWHGHVTAVTVSPEFRKLGVAKTLMSQLEKVSDKIYNGYFVDLFVRESNALAITMYKNLGYTIYRRVLGYYSGEEDAFGTSIQLLIL